MITSAYICVMYGASWYLNMGKKGKRRTRKNISRCIRATCTHSWQVGGHVGVHTAVTVVNLANLKVLLVLLSVLVEPIRFSDKQPWNLENIPTLFTEMDWCSWIRCLGRQCACLIERGCFDLPSESSESVAVIASNVPPRLTPKPLQDRFYHCRTFLEFPGREAPSTNTLRIQRLLGSVRACVCACVRA